MLSMRRSIYRWLFLIVVLCGIGACVVILLAPYGFWSLKLQDTPSVEAVLAASAARPSLIYSIKSGVDSHLCVSSKLSDLFTYLQMNYSDEQVHVFRQRYQETATLTVDGRTYLDTPQWVPTLDIPLGAYQLYLEHCVSLALFSPGRYVAQFSFELSDSETVAYTWVVERTVDGVIPEVTN